ncbi:LysR family transcriptional regulator [Amycolatopsis taiwanensis]|uniref:LysR family transcriptional regulator n=1 Tax=Amycolatopsis taiwanensis TaxID=342230 RepID=UPI0004BC5A22|nr:LysR family transcriptional regulator [Amycolatopsis taiwanensis]
MLNPVHLRTLATVVRTGSFADAARQLGYTGSAVSQQIAALERAVKLPLFERGAHSVRPTPVAAFLAGHARDALAALEQLDDELRALASGWRGRLRLGSFPTASERLLPACLAAYAPAHPAVEVRLDEGEPEELMPLLGDGELDLAVVFSYDLVPRRWPSGLQATPLLHEELVLLLPRDHRLAGAGTVELAELADETWVATREGTAAVLCVSRLCAAAGFEPRIDYRSNDYAVIRGFVRAGLGIALVPALGYRETESVVAVRLAGSDARRHITALHRATAVNPVVADAVTALRDAARALTRELPVVAA